MTYQCLNCGSQTRAGAKFCHLCGTPIATTSLPPTMPIGTTPPTSEARPQSASFEAPPAPRTTAATEAMPTPTAYISQAPQTYHTPPYPMPMQQHKKSHGGFKIVLITLAIIFALGIASVIGAVFFVRNKVQQVRRNIPSLPSINTSEASVPDDKIGAPVYPGAKRNSTVSGGFGPYSGTVVEFTSNDDLEKVADFYRDFYRGKEEFQFHEISNTDDDTGERSVVFQVGSNTGTRIITLTPDEKNARRTKIVMVGGGMAPPPKGGGQGLPPRGDIPVPPPPPADVVPPRR